MVKAFPAGELEAAPSTEGGGTRSCCDEIKTGDVGRYNFVTASNRGDGNGEGWNCMKTFLVIFLSGGSNNSR